MLRIFNSNLIGNITIPEKREKESVRSVILNNKKFPLKYTNDGNLTERKNPELFKFCADIKKNMSGEYNAPKTWWNRLNNKINEDGTSKSPMTQCEAVNLYIKLSESIGSSKNLSEEDLFVEIYNFLEGLEIQKEKSNQFSSIDNWIEACSLLQKQYSLFDSDLKGEGYCPKISKMAQLFGAKKASGIYLRSVEDICAVATIFACKDLSFYKKLEHEINKCITQKIDNVRKGKKEWDIVNDEYNALNTTVTLEIGRDILTIINDYRNDEENLIKELRNYQLECDLWIKSGAQGDNPFLIGYGIRRTQLKELYKYISEELEDITEEEAISDELIEKISGKILKDIVEDTNEHREIIKNFKKYSNIDEKLLEKINDEEVALFIRNALICFNAETYIDTIKRGNGNAESFKDNINQLLFSYGLRYLQENDANNYYIDWYVYNALSGYERLIARDSKDISEK